MKLLPYVWFGGKRRIASLVWSRFGDCTHYVEPFFGGGGVFFNRPPHHIKHNEIINDVNGYIVNFCRAVQHNPDGVCQYLIGPVTDLDKHARQKWLIDQRDDLVKNLVGNPEYHDVKIAAWWVWGINCHIGSDWCNPKRQRQSRVHLQPQGILMLKGIEAVRDYLRALQMRLQGVRILCQDWHRACDIAMRLVDWRRHATIGIFLDPPYRHDLRDSRIYADDDPVLSQLCYEFCVSLKDRYNVRIALCGLEGEHNELEQHGFHKFNWKARGGYNNMGSNDCNTRHLECIWFSPNCNFKDDLFLLD